MFGCRCAPVCVSKTETTTLSLCPLWVRVATWRVVKKGWIRVEG